VYHQNEAATMGHHCKHTKGGLCKCKCNTLFKGAYNPRTHDLYSHTIALPVDAPTLQPTSHPTKAPTAPAPAQLYRENVQCPSFTAEGMPQGNNNVEILAWCKAAAAARGRTQFFMKTDQSGPCWSCVSPINMQPWSGQGKHGYSTYA
jgi:hypothetical protein